jgi:hypothetical protein
MDEIPPQIPREVRKELKKLRKPWEMVKKKDHYFVKIGDDNLICIGNNGSKTKRYEVMRTVNRLRKA